MTTDYDEPARRENLLHSTLNVLRIVQGWGHKAPIAELEAVEAAIRENFPLGPVSNLISQIEAELAPLDEEATS
jgi:hypothetical protein